VELEFRAPDRPVTHEFGQVIQQFAAPLPAASSGPTVMLESFEVPDVGTELWLRSEQPPSFRVEIAEVYSISKHGVIAACSYQGGLAKSKIESMLGGAVSIIASGSPRRRLRVQSFDVAESIVGQLNVSVCFSPEDIGEAELPIGAWLSPSP